QLKFTRADEGAVAISRAISKDATISITRMMLRSLTLFSLMALAGCGYHQAGSAAHLPPNVQTLAVPALATNAQAYRTEMAFTQAVVRELNTRTKYRVTTSDTADADATLRGTILSETIAPLTYDATTSQSSSYLVTVTAKAVLTGHDGRVLYEND